MATYPIKMLRDENGQAFVPLTSLDAVMGEKNLQYILDAAQVSPGHFRVNYKDLKMKDLVNSIIVVRWPEITSTVKPSYLQLNTETEVILYNGTGTEYLDLEEASGTVNMLAYDGEKWVLTSGAGSGSGHVITDDEGHTMEQQKILNFVGFNVENDTANRATKIINPTPINNLTTTETGQGSLDAYQGYVLAGRSIPTGGTTGQVLAKKNGSDYQVEWIDRDSDDVITGNGSIEEIIGVTYEEYKALEAAGNLKATTQYHITDMTDGDISFVSVDDIQTMIDNSTQDFWHMVEYIRIAENTDLNTLVIPGFYRSTQTSVTATLKNMPTNQTSGFNLHVYETAGNGGLVNLRQELVRDGKTFIRYTNDQGVTWSNWLCMSAYDIGDIVTTSTNTNPGSRFGGTWQLIDKEFTPFVKKLEGEAEVAPYVTDGEGATVTAMAIMRTGHSLFIRVYFTTLVELADTAVTLATLNLNALGVSGLGYACTGVMAGCDGGNGVVNMSIADTGVIQSVDILHRAAAASLIAGATPRLAFKHDVTYSYMNDSVCSKFYWKRTA